LVEKGLLAFYPPLVFNDFLALAVDSDKFPVALFCVLERIGAFVAFG
jgi:hypothetical protein